MKTPATQKNQQRTTLISLLSVTVTIYYLCLIALRSTYPESYQHNPAGTAVFLPAQALSLITSFLILLPFAVALICKILSPTRFRLGIFEICAAIFVIFAAFSAIQAPDKRAAMNEILTYTAPILMAVFFIRTINASLLIELILITLTALGVVSAARCIGQVLIDNQALIEMYEQDPLSQLEQLGIEPGSFKHMLYEHRLKSKDVRGYFTTGNSAGSFFLLTASAAAALAVARIKKYRLAHPAVIVAVLAFIFLIFGLFLTHSKGAIGAFIIFAPLTAVAIGLRKKIIKYKKPIILITLLLALTAASAFVYIVMNEIEMPGGNSILVRSQYWKASIEMYIENSLLGVGPGNFPNFYPKYKIPAAPETVSKPHNFILNILTQYGPEALAAFLILAIIPIYRALFPADRLQVIQSLNKHQVNKTLQPAYQKLLPTAGGVICLFLIASRYLALPPVMDSLGDMQQVDKIEMYLSAFVAAMIMYGIPAIVFICSFYLLQRFNGQPQTASPENTDPQKINPGSKPSKPNTDASALKIQAIILSMGLAAVLLHNLIDFALFEPAVYTTYWLLAAVIIILTAVTQCEKNCSENQPDTTSCPTNPSAAFNISRTLAAAAVAVAITIYFWFAVITPVMSSHILQTTYTRPNETLQLCDKAAEIDKLDPQPYEFKGSYLLQQNRSINFASIDQLQLAAASLQKAILRNPHDFSLYKKRAIAFTIISALKDDLKISNDYIKMAHRACEKALNLYPGSAELQLRFAQLCIRLDQPFEALGHFNNAIQIEEQYREQFKKMYPGRQMFSRLGQQNYEMAIQNRNRLRKQLGLDEKE